VSRPEARVRDRSYERAETARKRPQALRPDAPILLKKSETEVTRKPRFHAHRGLSTQAIAAARPKRGSYAEERTLRRIPKEISIEAARSLLNRDRGGNSSSSTISANSASWHRTQRASSDRAFPLLPCGPSRRSCAPGGADRATGPQIVAVAAQRVTPMAPDERRMTAGPARLRLVDT
jgi:hypothetical protein